MDKASVLTKLFDAEDERVKNRTQKTNPPFKVIGVKMSVIRALAKKIKTNHDLAIALYDENYYETMMLGALIADPAQMDEIRLTTWAKQAASSTIIDQALNDLLLKIDDYQTIIKTWFNQKDTDLTYAYWSFLSTYFRKEQLDKIDASESLEALKIIEKTITKEPLIIQNAMNNAVVMAGLHVPELGDQAFITAEKIGYILPTKAKNSCNIQSATDYLNRYLSQPTYSRVAKIQEKKE